MFFAPLAHRLAQPVGHVGQTVRRLGQTVAERIGQELEQIAGTVGLSRPPGVPPAEQPHPSQHAFNRKLHNDNHPCPAPPFFDHLLLLLPLLPPPYLSFLNSPFFLQTFWFLSRFLSLICVATDF